MLRLTDWLDMTIVNREKEKQKKQKKNMNEINVKALICKITPPHQMMTVL